MQTCFLNFITKSSKFLKKYYDDVVQKIDPKTEHLTEYSINDVVVHLNDDTQIRLKGNEAPMRKLIFGQLLLCCFVPLLLLLKPWTIRLKTANL